MSHENLMNKNLKISWLWVSMLVTIFLLFVFCWIFVFGIYSSQKGSFFNKGHNAVWIGHEWVGEAKTDAEIAVLVNTLNNYQFDTVFVHSGPLESDGTIKPETYKYSVNFIEKAKKFDPGIKYQAWLGQIRNKIDLSDKDVRHNVVKQAMIMSQLVGFDGIHFDIEPVWDEDLDFINLLKETRETLPQGKTISVAMAEFIPSSSIWMFKNFHDFENYNTQVNYSNVAKYSDQIVVMAYDTGIKHGWLYRWLVREQTVWLSNLVEGKELFIGIPAYDEVKEGFDPEVENVENGLKGIVSGLNNIRSEEENFAGVAIYPYWEIDDTEWKTYEDLWLK